MFFVLSENFSLAPSVRFPDDNARLRGLAIFKMQTMQRCMQSRVLCMFETAT